VKQRNVSEAASANTTSKIYMSIEEEEEELQQDDYNDDDK
jgi:hypothetical protein